jgi:hypothetical protein
MKRVAVVLLGLGLVVSCQDRTQPVAPDSSTVDDLLTTQAIPVAQISLLKTTNFQDANSPPGPAVAIGETVTWEYHVSNIGGLVLNDIVVTDDQGVAVTCPLTTLSPGETMACAGSELAVPGQYMNTGYVQATGEDGTVVEASDISHYFGVLPEPALDLEKSVQRLDANDPPGPEIAELETVRWTFRLTNTGNQPLDVRITDDALGPICTGTLPSGGVLICTVISRAELGPHMNTALAEGSDPAYAPIWNTIASDRDVAHYLGVERAPRLQLEMLTNGEDADDPTGPEIVEGMPVEWTFLVTNTGNTELFNLWVWDVNNPSVDVSCPMVHFFTPGMTVVCTASGVARLGQYESFGEAATTDITDRQIFGYDPSHYLGVAAQPSLDLEKYTNGEDADDPTGPVIPFGSQVTWEFVVTNTGNVGLWVEIDDDVLGHVCSVPVAPGESTTCTVIGTAEPYQYANVGTAVGSAPNGDVVSDSDPSHYYGDFNPSIDVEKLTNGEDADSPPGPTIAVGDPVSWVFIVTNTGDVDLYADLWDDKLGSICVAPLHPGENLICEVVGVASSGFHENEATVAGTAPDAEQTVVSDSDESHYFGGGGVEVDIKPGSDPNCIKDGKKGVTPVAILGSETFDVRDVDPETVVLGDGWFEVEPLRSSSNKDVNEDGYKDFVFQFPTQELSAKNLLKEGAMLMLFGATYGGAPFMGWDVINLAGGPVCMD